jgi:integrase
VTNSTQEQISSVSQIAKDNFVEACRSAATRILYQKGLDYFMDYIKLGREEYDRLLERDPKLIQMDMIRFITHMKKKNNGSSTIHSYISGLNKFFIMNDVLSLNWKKIKSFAPEREKVAEDRPYNHDEIKKLLDITTPRNKALILIMSSAGLRVGGIPGLRVKDLIPIDDYGIYRINVYAKSKGSSYFTFCTPECRSAIDSYLDWRRRSGERITDDSPVFCIEYNAYDNRLTRTIKPCTANAITHTIDKLLRAIGMRGVGIENQEHKRREIMRSHGLRKFFETNAFKAGMDHIYIRRLMGQESGLEDAYLKLSEEELLEGDSKHVGYVGIIDQLTISNENRVMRENVVLKSEVSEIRQALDEWKQFKDKLGFP